MYKTQFKKQETIRIVLLAFIILVISLLHYNTPTSQLPFHLIYMQLYFIPIILAAFWFGVRGGLGTAIVISLIYLPHIMFQWGGFTVTNLVRFLQIALFLLLGYLTGLKAQGEKEEKERYQKTAQQLQKSLQELKNKTEQIFEMEQQLKSADRLAVIGELTANLAHEVRNPLGAIRGATEIIRDAVPQSLKNLEFFEIILQETKRLNEVVENYLNYARKPTRMVSVIDIKEVIHDVTLMLGPKARKNGIRLSVRLPQIPLRIKAEAIHIWQILMNILLNAIQAMPHGGEISIQGKSADDHIKITISDNGEGILEKHRQHIFESFYTTKPSGSGLGLAIVKRIADENHWQIALDSQEGLGTTFKITFPVEKQT
ncbi:sensor histidine kinase [candidate division KSB1 bacterium]|nr:MAG: sensor histidine kinase [candidate division KSB1 bacterium]